MSITKFFILEIKIEQAVVKAGWESLERTSKSKFVDQTKIYLMGRK